MNEPNQDRVNMFADVNDVRELIYQGIGAGSMCWENVAGAGVFEAREATDVAEDVLQRLAELGHPATAATVSTQVWGEAPTEL